MNKNNSVTVVGSFRKDSAGLTELYEQLTLQYKVLSPASIDWLNPDEEFVKSTSDKDLTVHEIEEKHLDAIRNSDFIVLFAPDGYVGVSAALEVGFAHAIGIPVMSTQTVNDQTIRTMVDGIFDKDVMSVKYGQGLKTLQRQYAKIAKLNGWSNESAKDTMLLLPKKLESLLELSASMKA